MDESRFLHTPVEAVHVEPQLMARLPESARRVFQAIAQDGPVTHAELRDLTGIPPRTIRYAVRRLKDEGLIDTRCSLEDCRTCYFFVHPRCIDTQTLQALRAEASTHDVVVQSWPSEGLRDRL